MSAKEAAGHVHIVLAIVCGLAGGLLADSPAGAAFGLLSGILAAEVLALRKRIARLEKERQPAGPPATERVVEFEIEDEPLSTGSSSGMKARPFASDLPPPAASPPRTEPDRRPAPQPASAGLLGRATSGIESTGTLLKNFFTTGNVVLKTGLVVLFFGVAFLLKYAAQRNIVPIELRLAAVALGGLGLLAAGWKLRARALFYGLGLQGGGVGVLYLTVFAAAKLYHLLPASLALAVMVGLVALSGALAVLQEARVLAFFGLTGGFLAPVLMSSGGGNHVLLFSYYALLNASILGISWFRAWRELNLAGFLFTFVISGLWGYTSYQPEHFSTTEPFLVLFFLFYVAISVLFALRQPLDLRGYIDTPLVFGLPLVAFGLQVGLVNDMEHGLALSALALGLFYAGLATVLWGRLQEGMRLLVEAFLAMAVVFGSLAVPLALDGEWTASTWALEGAALIWVGIRQNRFPARAFGLLLQLGGGLALLAAGDPFVENGPPFVNRFFLGSGLTAAAGLFSGWYLGRHRHKLRAIELRLPLPVLFLAWALLWWFGAGLEEVRDVFSYRDRRDGAVLFCTLSFHVLGMLGGRLEWPALNRATFGFLPVLCLAALPTLALGDTPPHFLTDWGRLAWPLAFAVQYLLLRRQEERWPPRLMAGGHAVSFWCLLAVLSHEAAWWVGRLPELAPAWALATRGLLVAAPVLLIIRRGARLGWPVRGRLELYLDLGLLGPVLFLAFWCFSSFLEPGTPAPLTYLPLANPLELAQLLVLLVLFFWARACAEKPPASLSGLPVATPFILTSLLLFLWLNSTAARVIHHFASTPFTVAAMFHSVVYQATLSILWTLTALLITVRATRGGRRQLWFTGAGLLGLVVLKLFLVDLSGTGTVGRIVSFLAVGSLMLAIGYFSPLPPHRQATPGVGSGLDEPPTADDTQHLL